MYLHLGQDTVIRTSGILGIFDLDTSTYSRFTRDFLKRCEQQKRVINVTMELPKSVVLCSSRGVNTVYISQLAPATLKKRAGGKKLK